MTAGELIALLKRANPEAEMFVSYDCSSISPIEAANIFVGRAQLVRLIEANPPERMESYENWYSSSPDETRAVRECDGIVLNGHANCRECSTDWTDKLSERGI